jgi:SHS2 domain-containing protein
LDKIKWREQLMGYKFLEHTADVKILAEDSSLEKVFSSAALALKELFLDHEPLKIKPLKSKVISIEGKDLEDLLYNFLEEFIYLLDAENFIISEIEDIEISSDETSYGLSAKIIGDDAGNYKFTNKVKAVTFNDMFVKEEKGKGKSAKSLFRLQFVLDV